MAVTRKGISLGKKNQSQLVSGTFSNP